VTQTRQSCIFWQFKKLDDCSPQRLLGIFGAK